MYALKVTLLLPAALVYAAQPSAPPPVAAPLRELPLGQLNFLATTDTHGWHAGHLQEPSYSADWGDYISFTQRMREKIEAEGHDLLVIDTGDRVEGNGLYDASSPKGNFTRPIFAEQHIDVICSGNHELYKEKTSTREYFEMVPAYKENYLASNLDFIDPESGKKVALSQRYRKFTTRKQGIKVLAFGFIFDFTGNGKNTVVQPVEETIKEQWFKEAINDRDVDIFVVAGHVGLKQSEFKNIHRAIRGVQWDTPIIFFGGHTHIRDYVKYDSKAYGLESGRYMETVGFQSISGLPTRQTEDRKLELRTASPQFARRYIDNNLYSYHAHTGLNSSTFPTEHGKNVSAYIAEARKVLDLDKTFGCAPQDLWMSRAPYPHNSSIFSWLETQVIPSKVIDSERADKRRIIVANTGAMRFDIFKGPFTKDATYIVCPFDSGFSYIRDVPYETADRLLEVLNNAGNILGSDAEARPLPESPRRGEKIGALTSEPHFDPLHGHEGAQIRFDGDEQPQLTPGYTTKDDAGTDGDDTLHSEITFYNVPNCIESRVGFASEQDGDGEDKPEPDDTVDVVFLEFIQPWVLAAMRFLGAEYEDGDVAPYMDGKGFTEVIAEWVGENWKGEC